MAVKAGVTAPVSAIRPVEIGASPADAPATDAASARAPSEGHPPGEVEPPRPPSSAIRPLSAPSAEASSAIRPLTAAKAPAAASVGPIRLGKSAPGKSAPTPPEGRVAEPSAATSVSPSDTDVLLGKPPELTVELVGRVARGMDPTLLLFVTEQSIRGAIMAGLRGARVRVALQHRLLRRIAADGTNTATHDASALLGLPIWTEATSDSPDFETTFRGLVTQWQTLRRRELSDYAVRVATEGRLTLTAQAMVRAQAEPLGLSAEDADAALVAVRKRGVSLDLHLPLIERSDGLAIHSIGDIARVAHTAPWSVIETLETSLSSVRLWMAPLQPPADFVKAVSEASAWVRAAQDNSALKGADFSAALARAKSRAAWHVVWAAGYHFLELGDPSNPKATRIRVRSTDQLTQVLDGRFRGEGLDSREIDEGSAPVGFETIEKAARGRRLEHWLDHQGAPRAVVESAADIERTLGLGKALTDAVARRALNVLAWRLGLEWVSVAGMPRIDGLAGLLALEPDSPGANTAISDGLLYEFVAEALGKGELSRAAKTASAAFGPALQLRVLQWKAGRRRFVVPFLDIAEPIEAQIIDAATQSRASVEALGASIESGWFQAWLEHTSSRLANRSQPIIAAKQDRASHYLIGMRALWALGLQGLPLFPSHRTAPPLRRLETVRELSQAAPRLMPYFATDDSRAALLEWQKHKVVTSSFQDALWVLGDTTLRAADATPCDGGFGGNDVPWEEARQALVTWLMTRDAIPAWVVSAVEDETLGSWLSHHSPPRAAALADRLALGGASKQRLGLTLSALGYTRLIVNESLTVSEPHELVSKGPACIADVERLLDEAALETWASDEGTARTLTALRLRCEQAAVAIAEWERRGRTSTPLFGDALPQPGSPNRDLPMIQACAADWLFLRNRAALALMALGAPRPKWAIAGQVGRTRAHPGPEPTAPVTVEALVPADVALDVAIPLVRTGGTVELIGLPLNESGELAGPPVRLGRDLPTVHVPLADSDAPIRVVFGKIVVPTVDAGVLRLQERVFDLRLRTTMPMKRLSTALVSGARSAPVFVLIGLALGAIASVAWLPLEMVAVQAASQGRVAPPERALLLSFLLSALVGAGLWRPLFGQLREARATVAKVFMFVALPALLAMTCARPLADLGVGLGSIAGWFPGFASRSLSDSVLIGSLVIFGVAGAFISVGRSLAASRFPWMGLTTEAAGALLIMGLLQ